MKRFSQRAGYGTLSELNVTPMLDLAFTLLIIFIITTPMLEDNIQIDLPTATATNQQEPSTPPRTVSIKLSGELYWGDRPLTLPQLETELRRLKTEEPNPSVVVRADRKIEYQRLIDVLDTLKRAQITRMGLTHLDD